MKVAVCISGQPRNYEKGFSELKKWFLDRYDCDVYIHAWKDTKSSVQTSHKFASNKSYTFTEEDYSKILELYQPKDYCFQLPIPFDNHDIRGPILGYKLNDLLSAGYSRQACYNLVEESQIKYDLVIRTRFDLEFTDYISPECQFLKDITVLNLDQLHVFEYPLIDGNPTRISEIDDLFAISSPEIMKVYSTYFSHIISYVYINEQYWEWLCSVVSDVPDKIVAESLLKYHIISNNIDINYVSSLTNNFAPNIIR